LNVGLHVQAAKACWKRGLTVTARSPEATSGQSSVSSLLAVALVSAVGSAIGGGFVLPTEDVTAGGLQMWQSSLRGLMLFSAPGLVLLEFFVGAIRHSQWLGQHGDTVEVGSYENMQLRRFEVILIGQLATGSAALAFIWWATRQSPVEFIGLGVNFLLLGSYCIVRVCRDRSKQSFGGDKSVPEPGPGSSIEPIIGVWRFVFGVHGTHGPALGLIAATSVMFVLAGCSFGLHHGEAQIALFHDAVRSEDEPRNIDPHEDDSDLRGVPPPQDMPGEREVVVVVRPGDSFWTIAEEHCAREGDQIPAEVEFRNCWLAWINANLDSLRYSDDPDLIFPGEEFVPPVPSTGVSSD
jgi:hypothetical protein